jgi:hypothetical protein
MATVDEIQAAVKIVGDFAGNPDSGVIAELLNDLLASTQVSTPTNEVRVVEAKETR